MLEAEGVWRVALARLAIGGCLLFGPVVAKAETTSWVQLVDGGAVSVRASIPGAACPAVIADGRFIVMSVRAPEDDAFPGVVCQTVLPSGVKHAELDGKVLPLPKARVNRMVMMGDTGCRVKGLLVQNCNDPKAWPFAAVAARAALERPDLVIHVGDYYYRETACPINWAGCAGSPHGDAWPTWVAEFFEPAKPLLDVAPWVFVRGNHETCFRGGRGWFRLLDASARPQQCPSAAMPFAVPMGGVMLHVLDSSDAADRASPDGPVSAFKAGLDTIKPTSSGWDWIITHRPIWGLVPVARLGPIGPLNLAINLTEQTAAHKSDLSSVQLVISGHIHHFAAFSFGPQRPAQLIVGTGGDVGEPADTPRVRDEMPEIDGMSAASLEFERYGYFVLDRDGQDWRGAFKDVLGQIVATCRLHQRVLACNRKSR